MRKTSKNKPQKKVPLPKYFSKKWERHLPELNSTAKLYHYTKTKTPILILKNKEKNKLFSVNFKTIPTDSTGLPHILEHSVLSGSKNYPIRDPFVEMAKSSLCTFINASTYPDKTLFPVTSQNHKDLENLAEVYLDAVFNPLLRKNTFKQEAWRYDKTSLKDDLKYSGIVFNEMKGAMSDPDFLIEDIVLKTLFPKSTYGFNSGGDPEKIPDLSYEKFIKFYNKYYHPSNAFVIMYGDVKEERFFQLLHKFLQKYDYKKITNPIKLQPKFQKIKTTTHKFSIDEKSNPAQKGMFIMSWMLDKNMPITDRFGLRILSYYLLNTDASPFKEKLMKSKLGEEIIKDGLSLEIQQPIFYTGLKNMNIKNINRVKKIILNELKVQSKQTVKEAIEGAINTLEFNLREGYINQEYPKTVVILQKILQTWLYGNDPLIDLSFEKPLKEIKQKMNNGEKYFENLISKYLLNNKHRADITMNPDPKLSSTNQAKEQKRLKQIENKMSGQQISHQIKETKGFYNWQRTPDAPEDISKVPKLRISDINPKAKKYKTELINLPFQNKLQNINAQTNGITHLGFCFEAKDLPEDLLPYISIYKNALTRLGTKTKGYKDLSIEIDKHSGGIYGTFLNIKHLKNNRYVQKFYISSKFLENKIKENSKLISEILNEIKFDNPKRLKEIILEEKSRIETDLLYNAHKYVLYRSFAKLDRKHRIQEQIYGLSRYFFLKKISGKKIDTQKISSKLKQIHKILIQKKKILVTYSNSSNRLKRDKKYIEEIIKSLGTTHTRITKKTASLNSKKDEGFVAATPVNFVSQAFKLPIKQKAFNAKMMPLNNYIRTEYLWFKIRMEGGAYSAGCNYDESTGSFGLYSYRDPNISKTLQIYSKLSNFLKKKGSEIKTMRDYIIGAISYLDTYDTPDDIVYKCLFWYLDGEDDDYRQKEKDAVLSTKPQDLQRLSSILKKASTGKKVHTILGNKSELQKYRKENKKLSVSYV